MSYKTVYQSPTNSIERSKSYYEKIGYTVHEVKEGLLVSDGQFLLLINQDRFARAGILLFKTTWKTELEALAQITKVHTKDNAHLFVDPSGTWVYLIEGEPSWDAKTEEIVLAETNKGLTGNFAGLSLESADIQRSIDFWKILGYTKTMGDEAQGWIAMENEQKEGVSFMKPYSCPHLFFNPSFTFFNGKDNNPKLIAQMRAKNVFFAEEVTHFNKEGIVDNVILRDPGGFGMFVFND